MPPHLAAAGASNEARVTDRRLGVPLSSYGSGDEAHIDGLDARTAFTLVLFGFSFLIVQPSDHLASQFPAWRCLDHNKMGDTMKRKLRVCISAPDLFNAL